MSDGLFNGKRFRTFNVLDDFNREVLAIEIDLSMPSPRVIRVLNSMIERRGLPQKLRMDNGPEFVSVLLANWAEEMGMELIFIQPGKPTQNSFIERFNRTDRTEVLDRYVFNSLNEARIITENWMKEYNSVRPYSSLNHFTPWEYLEKHA